MVDGREEEDTVHPSMQFIDERGNHTVAFFNDTLGLFKEAVKRRIEHEIRKRVESMKLSSWQRTDSTIKNLYTIADTPPNFARKIACGAAGGAIGGIAGGMMVTATGPVGLACILGAEGIGYLGLYLTDPSTGKDKEEAKNCQRMTGFLQKFGSTVESGNLCVVVTDKTLSKAVALRDTPDERYRRVALRFDEIISSRKSYVDKIHDMDVYLDEMLEVICPLASVTRQIDFGFTLNRADYYLNRIEFDRQNKDVETLKAMTNFRYKVNRLLAEHSFISLTNVSPILGIRLDRCKIVIDAQGEIMIFMDRAEIPRFLERIVTALDTKAAIILNEHSEEGLSGPVLRKLAEELRPQSIQLMLDSMDEELAHIKAERDTLKAEAFAEGAKVAIRAVGDGVKLALTSGASPVAPSVQAAAAAAADQGGRKNVSDKDSLSLQDMRAYVSAEEELDSSETTEEYANPLMPMLTAPCGYTVMLEPIEDIREEAPVSTEPRIDPGIDMSPIRVKKRGTNPTKIGRLVSEMNLSEDDVKGLLKGFKKYIESDEVNARLKIKSDQRTRLAALKASHEDFINLFKLYIKMVRGDYTVRTDIEGIVVSEIRRYESVRANGSIVGDRTLREYVV